MLLENKNKMPKDNNKDSLPFTIDQSSLVENFVIFKTESGKVNIDVFYQDKTLWLTQKTIAELFEKGRSTITEHLKKIFEDADSDSYREDEASVCRDFRHTAEDGKYTIH